MRILKKNDNKKRIQRKCFKKCMKICIKINQEKYILILILKKYAFIYTFLNQRYNIVTCKEG